MKVYSRDCCTEGSVAEQRASAHYDRVNHGSVQPWSAGPLFPAVIAVVERYRDHSAHPEIAAHVGEDAMEQAYLAVALEDRLLCTSYELILGSRSSEYASREDAELVARALIASPELQAKWGRKEEGFDLRLPLVAHDAMGVT